MNKKYYKILDVIKSNQRPGAMAAWLVGKKYRIPFYFRTGYTDSNIYPILHKGKLGMQYKQIRIKEKFLYQKCDIAAVSSEHDRKYVCKEYGVSRSKVKLVRNYIDIDMFQKQIPIQHRDGKVVYIGRLAHPKNLFCLLQAVDQTGISLDIYGDGEQRKALEEYAQELKIDVSFKGTVSNREIPNILNRYKYYILASSYEGMPKTLLEAMACGCICIGTPVEGISEVIKDEVNGFLAKGMAAKDIAEVIQRAYMFEDIDKISDNASQLILSLYSLTEIAQIDKGNFQAICYYKRKMSC